MARTGGERRLRDFDREPEGRPGRDADRKIHREPKSSMPTMPLAVTAPRCDASLPAAPRRQPTRCPRGTTAAAKKAIVDFVEKVTKEGSPDFVPAAERIATFDNDGTLWAEQPMYFQLLFALDRVKALAPQHPEWKDKEPFASLLKGDVKGALAGGEHGASSRSSWPPTPA